jgi:hypothetical protein
VLRKRQASESLEVVDSVDTRPANIADYVIAILDARTSLEWEKAWAEVPPRMREMAEKWVQFVKRPLRTWKHIK